MKKSDRNKEQALLILATTPNYTEAAQKLGVTATTIYEWLKDPEFAANLGRQRNQLVEEAASKLKGYITKAVDTLGLLLDDESAQIRRGAANDILNHVMNFKETMEFDVRLSELEKRVSSAPKTNL